MIENEYNVNLAGMSDLFNNKTLTYRINGFAYACKMKNIMITKNDGVIFNTSQDDEVNYFIVANKRKDKVLGESITINGNYGDLIFTFANYPKNKNLDRKVIEIPFNISLFRTVDQDTYRFTIETVDDIETKFTMTVFREYKDKTISSNKVFYANILDFSNVLKLVEAFVYNPKLVFSTYSDIMNTKKIVLTSEDVKKAIMQDVSLDKPVGKIEKKLKKVIG